MGRTNHPYRLLVPPLLVAPPQPKRLPGPGRDRAQYAVKSLIIEACSSKLARKKHKPGSSKQDFRSSFPRASAMGPATSPDQRKEGYWRVTRLTRLCSRPDSSHIQLSSSSKALSFASSCTPYMLQGAASRLKKWHSSAHQEEQLHTQCRLPFTGHSPKAHAHL